MPPIPHDRSCESTLALLREGYAFIPNRCRRLRSDIFRTRLMLQEVVCISGPEAGAVFYDNDKFRRQGVMPRRIQKTLTGSGGVQGLDGERHRQRKAMFMRLMGEGSIANLAGFFTEEWNAVFHPYQTAGRLVLFDMAQRVLFRAVCRWSGVPLHEAEAGEKARWMGEMVDGFGTVGPRHWRGRAARKKSEAWAQGIIREARRTPPPVDTALAVIAGHHEGASEPLDIPVAAVELLNILRPVVAIATYIAFIGAALHRYPAAAAQAREDAAYRRHFVQEVRRFYPFTPFVGARACQDIEWQGYPIPEGKLVLLDIYGIDRDPRIWEQPDAFLPERFAGRREDAFDFMPQGGGDQHRNHRCAGEWITIALMEQAVERLTRGMTYHLPEGQELDIDLSRIPTLPASGVRLADVRLL